MDTVETLTISEAAALLGRSKQYVWNCLVDGRLPHAPRPDAGSDFLSSTTTRERHWGTGR